MPFETNHTLKNELKNQVSYIAVMKKAVLLLMIIGILSSCSKNDIEAETREFVPGEVTVGIKSGTGIHTLFHFINQFGLETHNVHSLIFTSELPSDSLQYVLDVLNDKIYTNDGTRWFVTGYLHYQTQEITIFPRLFGIDNVDFQRDWLQAMHELKLNERHHTELNSGVIHFRVPTGKEIKWRNLFLSSDIVDWSELNYIADIVLF